MGNSTVTRGGELRSKLHRRRRLQRQFLGIQRQFSSFFVGIARVHLLRQRQIEIDILAVFVLFGVGDVEEHLDRFIGQPFALQFDDGAELIFGLHLFGHAQIGDVDFDLRPFLADADDEDGNARRLGSRLDVGEHFRRAFGAAAIGDDDDALHTAIQFAVDQRQRRAAEIGAAEKAGIAEFLRHLVELLQTRSLLFAPFGRRFDLGSGVEPGLQIFARQRLRFGRLRCCGRRCACTLPILRASNCGRP